MTEMNTFHLCKDGMPLLAHPDSVGTVHEKKKKNDVALNKPSINVLKMHKSKEKKKEEGYYFSIEKKKKRPAERTSPTLSKNETKNYRC